MKNFNYKYIIRDFIDKNKWSNVYIGINKETNEKIILNILINLEGHEENLEKFKEEVNLLKDIKSSNVISINGMSTYINKDKTYYYIESEDFEGLTLDELTRINKLHENQCLQIIREVIKGVIEFNNKKINFSDLTTEDIIINGEGIVKINTISFINNHKGHINCKLYNGKKFDSHQDVYAIGSILCEMITGQKKLNPEVKKNLDKNISEILEKSTNKKHISNHKYKDLREFLKDVDLYLDGGEINGKVVVNFEKIHKFKPNPKIKKYVVISCSVAVLLCTTAFGAQYLMNRNEKNTSTTDTSEGINKTEENTDDNNTLDITPVEENLITPDTTSEDNKQENVNNDENNKDNTEEDVNNQHNSSQDDHDDKDTTTDKKEPDRDNTDQDNTDKDNTDNDNSDKDNSDKDDNKDDNNQDQNPDDNKDNTDEDTNPDEEKPDKDNSDEEKPDQNLDKEQNDNNDIQNSESE